MGVLDLFRRKAPALPAPEAKASAVAPLVVGFNVGRPVWQERAPEQIAREVYQRSVIGYACVWFVARALATVPLQVCKRPLGGDSEPIDVPDLARLLDRPNPVTDGASWRQEVASDLLLYGECFQERVDLLRLPRELYRWEPPRVGVTPGPLGWAESYTYRGPTSQERIVPVDPTRPDKCPVLHLREYNPLSRWRGLSPMEPASWALDSHTAASAWNKALIENGARPSGALVYTPQDSASLTDDQRTFLKQQLEQAYSGPGNSGRPLILEGAFDWKQLGLSPVDMDFRESKAAAAREIALAVGVPPVLLGLPGDSTYSNYQEANKAFYRQTVLPLLWQFCRGWTWWLGSSFGPDVCIEPDIDDLPVFADERAARWTQIQGADFLTINEKRIALGFDTVDGGDVVLVPSSMVPLEAAATMPAGGPEPDDAEDDGKVGGKPTKAYDPNQPRDPAGTSTGGQWTDGDSTTGMDNAAFSDDVVAVIAADYDKNSHDFYGIRVADCEWSDAASVGDVLPNSYRWEDGEWTDEQLDGTSTVGVRASGDIPKQVRAAVKLINGPHGSGYFGKTIYIVAGDKAGDGEDPGELVIQKPRVVAVYARPKEMGDGFKRVK